VVLQGDVTGIISMNARERREIIDELAGVAAFDRKIDQAKGKLDAVREHEERFHIVERELRVQLERLAQDRQKAEKYQKLKATFQSKSQWEAVLVWQGQQRQITTLQQTIERGQAETVQLNQTITQAQQTAEDPGCRPEYPQCPHQGHGGRRTFSPAVSGGYPGSRTAPAPAPAAGRPRSRQPGGGPKARY
jgi:DNA repair exonuclease SbcCD ATPase subunit